MSDTKPWEGEKAPTQATPEEIAAAEAAATAKAEKAAADAEVAKATTDAAKAEAEAKAEADAKAKAKDTENTPSGKATGAGSDAPTKPVKIKSKEHGDIVVGGPQANLALVNLVSRGVPMKDAKKQLGIK